MSSHLFRFQTEEEAVEIANSTQSGLASYFYSQDVSQVSRVTGYKKDDACF